MATYTRLLMRRRTAAQWASLNEILMDGELGIVTDLIPRVFKIGDGITTWASLPFAIGAIPAGSYAGAAFPSTVPATPAGAVFYSVSTSGTYTGFGNLVLPANSMGFIGRDSSNTSWVIQYFSVDLTPYALKTDVAKIVPTSYDTVAAPPTKVGDTDNFTINNNFTTIGRTFTSPTYISPYKGYVARFGVKLTNAESGRIIRFYIVSKISDTSYLPKYDSGDILAEAAGNNYFTPVFASVPIDVNDFLAVYVKQTSGANGLSFYASGGPSIGQVYQQVGTLTIGAAFTPSSGSTQYRIPLSADIIDSNLFVVSGSANKPNGYLRLGTEGVTDSHQLPVQISGNELHNETPVTLFLNEKKLPAIVKISGGVEKYNFGNAVNGTGGLPNTSFPNRILITTLTATQGFMKTGILNELRIAPVSTSIPGAKVQAWVVRLINGVFNLVETIGEIDASVAARWHVFRGLSIFVKKGDFIAVRGIDTGLTYWSGSGSQIGYQSWIFTQALAPDLTLSGFNIPITPSNPGASTVFNYEADISNSYVASKDVPGGSVGLNTNGNIPINIGRSPDLYWQQRKIIWVGTSIPAGNATAGGGAGAGVSYPVIAGTSLDAVIDNQAVGSSGIIWDGTRNLSLSATSAELTAAFGAANAGQSYEMRILGKGAQLVVFDHGYNDRLQSSGSRLGTLPWSARTGTITSSTGSMTVTGVGTLFTTEFKIGDKLYNNSYQYIGKILSIDSTISLTLTANSGYAVTNASFLGISMDRTTFYGAFNYVIDKCYDENPLMSFAFITPPNRFASGGTETATATTTRTSILALADSYNAPVCDLMKISQYNPRTFPVRTIDGIHPTEAERPRLGNILYNFLKGIS